MKTVFEVAQTMTTLVKLHIGIQESAVWEAVVDAEVIIAGELAIRKAEVSAEVLEALEDIGPFLTGCLCGHPPSCDKCKALRGRKAAIDKAKGGGP